MNEHHPIDELFREAISQVELPPSDKIWASLDKQLGQKSQAAKKGKYLFSSAVVAGSLLVAGSYFLSDKNTTPVPAENHAVVQNPVVIEPVVTNIQSTESEKTQPASIQNTTAVTVKETVPVKTDLQPQPDEKNYAVVAESVKEQPGKKEQIVKSEANTVAVNKETPAKKEISDKDIKLVPSYPAEQSQQRQASQPSKPVLKNDAGDTPAKTETAMVTNTSENVIYVPNAFTPNGDGLNDVFLPKTAEEPKEYKLYIFDPTGNMVFYSDDFSKGWDGKVTHNGIEATKEGVYMWKMEVKNNKGEKEVRMGYVNLLK